jgi:hypothetical protein
LIDHCLTFNEQYVSYIHDENKGFISPTRRTATLKRTSACFAWRNEIFKYNQSLERIMGNVFGECHTKDVFCRFRKQLCCSRCKFESDFLLLTRSVKFSTYLVFVYFRLYWLINWMADRSFWYDLIYIFIFEVYSSLMM